MKRRSKSSIDRLPPPVKQRIEDLLKQDQHTLDELIQVLQSEFPSQPPPSRSSLGRYSKRFEEVGRKIRESREVAKVWAERLGNEPEGDIGKLVMEILRTLAFDATMAMQEPDDDGQVQLDPAAINKLALAMQRLEAAGKWNIQREEKMRESIVSDVESKLTSAPKKLDAETLSLVRQAIRGES